MRRNAPIYIWRKSAKREWFPKHEASLDALAGGSLAVIEQAGRKQLQFEACVSRAAASGLLQNFGGTMEKLPPDWLARFSSSKTAKPIRIGARLVIANGEEDPASEGHSLHIPAGAAFGTGEHATTAMSLRMLERLTRARPAGWRLFDAGTGSGILALAAARFGAKEVVAIDNDPTAIATAKENARANRISGSRFVIGDVSSRYEAASISSRQTFIPSSWSRCCQSSGNPSHAMDD